eukprot:330004_1
MNKSVKNKTPRRSSRLTKHQRSSSCNPPKTPSNTKTNTNTIRTKSNRSSKRRRSAKSIGRRREPYAYKLAARSWNIIKIIVDFLVKVEYSVAPTIINTFKSIQSP